ncbi:MAG: acetyl-CoA carboxylase biotin carboxylase subunit [Verrucomicrobiota bacterium]
MVSRLLIANRGEIALRIVRACRELGVHSIVAYSQADEETLAVQLADEAICIGPPPSPRSYLDINRIIAAAEVCNVDAIHPGYGFLAENGHFAEVCRDCNITFVGPPAASIEAMGNKSRARETMIRNGVPVTPGSDGVIESEDEARKLARKMGYPVIIKASAGGGGKGMRIVHNDASLIQGFHAARLEAEMGFGCADVYMEKFVENPRHVEFQVFADHHGNAVHLGERDCSLQRRNQKLIEEAPCPVMTPELRAKMGESALQAVRAADYVNAGTVEFLLSPDGEYYFMEMNTRIQVEHPVTEAITGLDLVKEQILVAGGEPLSFTQESVRFHGHAIEVRINAENPYNDFRPSPGEVLFYVPPGGPGVRVDSHAYSGYLIPPHYDSMVGKLIVWGKDREEALCRTRRALNEFLIDGVSTTIDFAGYLLNRDEIIRGEYNTGTVTRLIEEGLPIFDNSP